VCPVDPAAQTASFCRARGADDDVDVPVINLSSTRIDGAALAVDFWYYVDLYHGVPWEASGQVDRISNYNGRRQGQRDCGGPSRSGQWRSGSAPWNTESPQSAPPRLSTRFSPRRFNHREPMFCTLDHRDSRLSQEGIHCRGRPVGQFNAPHRCPPSFPIPVRRPAPVRGVAPDRPRCCRPRQQE